MNKNPMGIRTRGMPLCGSHYYYFFFLVFYFKPDTVSTELWSFLIKTIDTNNFNETFKSQSYDSISLDAVSYLNFISVVEQILSKVIIN